MLKTAILIACGSFSPITYAHLRMFEMAKDVLNDLGYTVEKGYLSPVSDSYKKKGLAQAKHRIVMIELAIATSPWLQCSTWEAEQEGFTPTAQVLRYISDSHNRSHSSKAQVFFVAGSDLVKTFLDEKSWAREDIRQLTEMYQTIVIQRKMDVEDVKDAGKDVVFPFPTIAVKQEIVNEISSTKLREFIAKEKSIRYLTDDHVVNYILRNNLYKPSITTSSVTTTTTGTSAMPSSTLASR